MNREKILKLLEDNENTHISGQSIAKTLDISRNAVWKHVNALRAEGYLILSEKSGYMLKAPTGTICLRELKKHLKETVKIELFPSLPSTNTFAISSIDSDTKPRLIIALEQTAGRGRLEKKFASPRNSGIYMTLLLPNKIANDKISLVTAMTSVAVCKAITDKTQNRCKIKWVNDIFLNDKKVCGILTEGVNSLELGKISHLAIGIGINTDSCAIPLELKDIATALNVEELNKNVLIYEIVANILTLYNQLAKGDISFLDYYRKHSLILGKSIRYKKALSDEVFTGDAVSISDDGSLNIRLTDGTVQNVVSGEISVMI